MVKRFWKDYLAALKILPKNPVWWFLIGIYLFFTFEEILNGAWWKLGMIGLIAFVLLPIAQTLRRYLEYTSRK